MKIVLKRVREPILLSAMNLLLDAEKDAIKNSWFLCRKGQQIFTSHLFFSTENSLHEKDKYRVNTLNGYLHVVFNDYVTYGAEELDELNMILLR